MKRTKKDFILLYIKGCLMGAADAVPGVSGGTIAFITGIYQELIDTLSQFGITTVKQFINEGPLKTWSAHNGSFLIILISGMLSSILMLSHLVLFLITQHPLLLWGFFFGLIAASSIVLFKTITQWSFFSSVVFLLAAFGAYFLTTLSATALEPNLANVFIAGMLAICAMILPGISGSFILLLLGLYTTVLGAVKSFELLTLAVFAMGCVCGLLSFSKVLSWLFRVHRNLTMTLLTGFLLGSLSKTWPWKEVLTTRINSKGDVVADLQVNILPSTFEQLTQSSAQLVPVGLLMLLGATLVLSIDRYRRQ